MKAQPSRARSGKSRDQGGRDPLERRVVEAAEAALAQRKHVSPIDVLVGVGWLQPRRVEEWRQGRVDYLERVTQADLSKLSRAMKTFRRLGEQPRP